MRALEKAGFYVKRQKGSHVVMCRDDPSRKLSCLRSIIRQAGLTVDEFVNLL
jgi:predicted RNA binding protein YcfA (HicA-like mRNA interferase family)